MAICHTLTSTFSCVNYTLNSFGFLVQKTLFRVINFLIYKEWRRGGNTLRTVCIPGQDLVQISALCFSPACRRAWVDRVEALGGWLCLGRSQSFLQGLGHTVSASCSGIMMKGSTNPHLICEYHTFIRCLPSLNAPLALWPRFRWESHGSQKWLNPSIVTEMLRSGVEKNIPWLWPWVWGLMSIHSLPFCFFNFNF